MRAENDKYLKPCPFCGNQPMITPAPRNGVVFISCRDCKDIVVETSGRDHKEAADIWNWRYDDQEDEQ